MSDCDQCRQIIDRFEASESQQQAWAQTHVQACEACRDYKAAADATRALLGLRNSAAPPGSPALAAVQERVRKDRRQTAIAASGAMASLIALLWLTGRHGVSQGTFILLAWFVGSSAFAWWSGRRARRHLEYRDCRDFFESWRREVNHSLWLTRVIAAAISLEVLAWLILGAIGGFSGDGHPILLLVNGVLGAGAIYAWLVEIPTLARERDLIHE